MSALPIWSMVGRIQCKNAHVTLSGRLDPFLLKRKWGLKVSTLPWSNKQGQKRKLY